MQTCAAYEEQGLIHLALPVCFFPSILQLVLIFYWGHDAHRTQPEVQVIHSLSVNQAYLVGINLNLWRF